MALTNDTKPGRRGLPLGKLLLSGLAGFALALGFGAGAIVAYQGQYADRIYPGTSVAGVDLSGLSREAAAARLERDLAGYATGSVVVTLNGSEARIPYAAVGRRADVATLVDLAWSVGRSDGDPLGRATEGVRALLDGARIDPVVVADAEMIARQVERAAARVDVPPVDATAIVAEKGFTTTPAAPGRGLPRDDVAQAVLDGLTDPGAPTELRLSFEPVPITPDVSDEDASSAVLAATRMARDIELVRGKEAWKIKAATVRTWIEFSEAPTGEYAPAVTADDPVKALKSLAKKIDRAPRDASFLVGRGTTVVGVRAGKNGRSVDIEKSAAAVAEAVNARAAVISTDAPPAVKLAVAVVEPKLTTEEAEKTAPLMKRLSRWTTYYEVSERNGFSNNISIPTRDINGYVVQPGAVFDFWKAVGPVTYERGYRDGGAILNGRTEPTGALAGGICSCSTTLFNAAARAGLKILERDNHYYFISRYPTGLDATVWKSGSSAQSMRFRNDTKHPILIRGIASPGVVTFEIWGPPTGRKVTFSRPTIRNVVRAIDTVQYTSSLAPGVRKRIEYPVNGMNVWVTRTVRDKNGKVLHRDTWYSDYRRVNGIVLVGKSTKAPAAEATPTPEP